MNGTNIQIYMESATPGTYDLLGSQRGVTITENTAVIDESTKESRNFVGSPGRYTCTIDCDALYVPNDTAYGYIQDAMRNGTTLKLEFTEDGGTTQTENIDSVCTALTRTAPDQGEALVSASFQATGDWAAAT